VYENPTGPTPSNGVTQGAIMARDLVEWLTIACTEYLAHGEAG
jgi:hypothetical protein